MARVPPSPHLAFTEKAAHRLREMASREVFPRQELYPVQFRREIGKLESDNVLTNVVTGYLLIMCRSTGIRAFSAIISRP